MFDVTLKSSYDGTQNKEMPSMSSGTSYGKEPVFDNTIEQILGNVERSNLGQRRDVSHDSLNGSRHFRH